MITSTMNKGLFLSLLFLVGCVPIGFPTASPTISRTVYPTAFSTSTVSPTTRPIVVFLTSFEAFDISDQCPHICWMGINPGVTSAEDARILLKASDQIDQEKTRIGETDIVAYWFFQKTTAWSSQVTIRFEQGLVKSISIYGLVPAPMSEVLHLLGEPDKIKIRVSLIPHGGRVVTYALYYSSRKTLLYAVSRGWDGPDPNDNVNTIILNTDEFGFESDVAQPWLGYGHLKDYLPGVEIPTPIP